MRIPVVRRRGNSRRLRRPVAIGLLLLACLTHYPAAATLRFHWEDHFSQSEQNKLTAWLTETQNALEELVGELPFTVHVFLNRASAGEPVPWAHTERSAIQGVHFHVDPSYSLESFREDWTAPHELSHLIIPYVGRQHSWFAEGFASYMQYQVMHQMGVLSDTAMRKRYARNLAKAERRYQHDSQPFSQAAPRLRAERNYPTMYWGGASLFLQADDALMQKGEPGLVAALKAYVGCCRLQSQNLAQLVATLDKLCGGNELSQLLKQFQTRPGFPKHDNMDMGPSALAATDQTDD